MSRKAFLVSLFMLVTFVMPGILYAQQLTRADLPRLADKSIDRHMVIVQLRDSEAMTKQGFAESPAEKKVRIKAERDAKISLLRGEFSGRKARKIRIFNNPQLMSMDVSRAELSRMLDDPELLVFENRWHKPFLADSVAQVYPSQTTSGLDGSGWAVAILDTGVNKNHAFFSGKIIEAAEACFSNDNNSGALPGGESLCPAGAGSATGSGAGVNCSESLTGCDHGTKMAGIVAGSNMSMKGVAPGIGLIPVQVYSGSTDETVCGGAANTPCIGALTTDIIRALEYVHSIRTSHQIAAVNISLGTLDTFEGFCDAQPEKAAIDDLRAVGIATVAASGNAGESNKMASPACVSSAVAVAATNDADDQPWAGNNRSSALDFFAPGVSVSTSTLPVSAFSSETGTSVAAPHVAGGWAILKEAGASGVSQIENLFKSTGVLVTQGGNVSKKRINITQALDLFNATPVNNDDDDFCFPIKANNGNVAVICL